MPWSNKWIAFGAVSACIAVICGALGSHALKGRLDPSSLNAWRIATDYQLAHGISMIVVSLLRDRHVDDYVRYRFVPWLFAAGTLLFCGSLYGLALTKWSVLGPITPLGGTCFIAGWSLLAFRALTAKGSAASQMSDKTQQDENTNDR